MAVAMTSIGETDYKADNILKIKTDMKRLMYVTACIIVLAACSKEQEPVQATEQLNGSETVLATAKDFVVAGMTKTVITQSGSDAPAFAWKEGDVIGIIPMNNETVQSNYKIAEIGANPKNATFDGGVWALKEGKEYAAYYPFNEKIARSGDILEFSFLNQTQSANNSLEHLGAYDYMYASAVVPQSGSAQFDFNHKISLVRLQLTVPNADTYTKVQLESTESWFTSGASLKLSDGTMTATETVKSATINLNNITVAANGVLTVWFATLPTSALSGQTLSVKLFGNETTCTGDLTGFTTFTAGNAYSYAITLVESQEIEYVDLGLSVKWASCNLGANSPEEYGDYYAWGETETYYQEGYAQENPQKHWKSGKSSGYSNDSYRFYKSEIVSEGGFDTEYKGYNKYISQKKADSYGFRGFYDDKTVLDPEDDVAHVKLGGKWRMPTNAEFTELINNCQCDWVTYKGVKGRKFTSKKTGYTDKWIFLPAVGYRDDDRLYYVGSFGDYWSSSLNTNNPYGAYYLSFNSGSVETGYYSRCRGLSVRPVSE